MITLLTKRYMSREIKYTTDGKKVVVIGSLNSQEKIVQEIFIVGESEIPSGEHFVVKSSHDAPAISWKEKEIARIHKEYETTKFEGENQLKVLRARYRTISEDLRNKIEYAGKVIKNISPGSFESLIAYLTGEIKYIVEIAYTPKLIEWKDWRTDYDNKIRLVSIYGRDEGDLRYGINNYSDTSGGTTNFKPFTDYEDALAFFKEKVIACTIHDDIIKIADKYDIALDEQKLKKYKEDKLASINKSLEGYNKAISQWNEQIIEIQAL